MNTGHGYASPQVQGDRAHDSVDGGFPVKIGGKAATSLPAAVANGGRVNAFFDANGRLHVIINTGTGAADLGKAEGSTHVSGDTGTMALTVRQDTPAALAANGAYQPLSTDNNGRLYVVELNSTAIGALLTTLAGIVTSARAAVNPIAGQAGVQGGAGAVSANTQRTVTATDDLGVVSLGVIDDWDESDRAKVNPIVGQAGVDGNVGTATAKTQRVTQAHDAAWLPLSARYTTAQTDTAVVSASGGQKIVVKCAGVGTDNANTGDVGFRLGFGATNTPTTTGVILAHPGLPAGSGRERYYGESGVTGGDGEDLRITSEAPGANFDVDIVYKII